MPGLARGVGRRGPRAAGTWQERQRLEQLQGAHLAEMRWALPGADDTAAPVAAAARHAAPTRTITATATATRL